MFPGSRSVREIPRQLMLRYVPEDAVSSVQPFDPRKRRRDDRSLTRTWLASGRPPITDANPARVEALGS
jgi:hypothetical protein